MDSQTFLDNLKRHADHLKEISQIPDGFYGFFKDKYETYTSATPKERDNLRDFVKSPSKSKSFLGGIFQSKQEPSQIAHLLLIYVKERAFPQLKSTKDDVWLYRGLAAISMDDFSGPFDD